MTQGPVPLLDRLISRSVSGPVGPDTLALRYENEVTGTVTPGAGEYNQQGSLLMLLGATDSDGVVIPAGSAARTIRITGISGFNTEFEDSYPLTAFADLGTYFEARTAAGHTFTDPKGTIRVTLGGGTSPVTTQEIWAARRDFPVRDFVQGTITGPVSITDRRYIVRAETGPWADGDNFTDEEGENRVVRGVVEFGPLRGRFLELLARRLG